jgi:hypothetical protein
LLNFGEFVIDPLAHGELVHIGIQEQLAALAQAHPQVAETFG